MVRMSHWVGTHLSEASAEKNNNFFEEREVLKEFLCGNFLRYLQKSSENCGSNLRGKQVKGHKF